MTKPLTPEEKAANKAARAAARGKPEKATKKSKKSEKVVAMKPSKKSRKADAAHAPAGKGHNRGNINEDLKELFTDYMKMEEDKKAISKAQRDLRARAKEEHGVTSDNFNHEIKLQKWDNDRRVMFETGAGDLKNMLGIQLALSLNNPNEDEDEQEEGAPDPDEAAERAASN